MASGVGVHMAEDPRNLDRGLKGQESLFDKRLREFRTTGQIEKPVAAAKSLINTRKTFETPIPGSASGIAGNEEHSEIERLAFIDPLTENFNGRTILSKLAIEVKRARRYKRAVGVLMLQIDGLENIASTIPALAFETLMRGISNTISKNLREVDLRGKFDDNKFLVVCPETSLEQLNIVAERLRNKFSTNQTAQVDQSFSATVSVGISAFPRHGESEKEVMEAVAQALASASARGGNQIVQGKRVESQEQATNFVPPPSHIPAPNTNFPNI
ncbi:MAG: GGDEF domain-containing protein [Candidatus Obscuribacterales bacterium]|nr:GGDEF domain-containing protein [Candidatus Obscuribacterales bacterium]